jgi:pyruvate,water dikinase
MGEKVKYVLNFNEIDKNSLNAVGGKNASLGEMIKAGIRVPPGFAVTTECYLDFITETGIKKQIFDILDQLNGEDISSVDAGSEKIQALFTETEMPEKTRSSIIDAYSELCEICNLEAVPVAVRSSATAEDLPTASFAGQQDTYLWVLGTEQIVQDVKRCWASLFASRAISYRLNNNFPHDKVLISVGVQKMVHAKAAGVMFTLNPTNGDLSKVVIEGSWGLGETVVSGSVTPDKFVVDKVIMEVSEKTISRKHIECVFDINKSGVIDVDVAPERQTKCCLEDQEIMELVRTAINIENHYGRPMDIEWSIDEDLAFPDNVFVVQARPETVWSQKKKESVIGKKSGYQLLMEQAMKRIKIT